MLAGERLAEHPLAADLALAVASKIGSRFGYVTRRANDRGALGAGVHPSLLPGGRRLGVAGERAEVEAVWGPIMASEEGRDAQEILQACADRSVDVLFVIGADPLRDHPDAVLARRALANVATLVVQSVELGALEPFASVFLPAAPAVEKDGHLVPNPYLVSLTPFNPESTWERLAGHQPPRLGDLRRTGRRDGFGPGVRNPRGAPWGDGVALRSAGHAGAAERLGGRRRAAMARRSHAVHVPTAR